MFFRVYASLLLIAAARIAAQQEPPPVELAPAPTPDPELPPPDSPVLVPAEKARKVWGRRDDLEAVDEGEEAFAPGP
jgi:hypothetical protein